MLKLWRPGPPYELEPDGALLPGRFARRSRWNREHRS